jgi:plasmid stabilization system protein ParE
MGTKVIWSYDALEQLEDIHFYIFFESKSIEIADKVANTIFESTEILKTNPEIYKLCVSLKTETTKPTIYILPF